MQKEERNVRIKKKIGNNPLHRSALYAYDLRSRATLAERELCRLLDAAMISYIFQSNICDLSTGRIYVADFRIRRDPVGRPSGVSRKDWKRDTRKVFVEVDGGYHVERQAYDFARTRWIESHRNAVVLRFSNEDVFVSPSIVIAEIERYQPAHKTTRVSWSSPLRDFGRNKKWKRRLLGKE